MTTTITAIMTITTTMTTTTTTTTMTTPQPSRASVSVLWQVAEHPGKLRLQLPVTRLVLSRLYSKHAPRLAFVCTVGLS